MCGDLAAGERREWLVTNGIGGYAMGTVPGLLTRRYHGLLIGATDVPVARSLLVPKIDERAMYGGHEYALFVNRWAGGTVDPQGHRTIESFHLGGTAPVWRFACADAIIEKRLWMVHGRNASAIRYFIERGGAPVVLQLDVFIDGRDHHGTTRASAQPPVLEKVADGFCAAASPGSPIVTVTCAGASWVLDPVWYYNFDLAREHERGLDAIEDHVRAAVARIELAPGQSCTVVLCDSGGAGDTEGASWQSFSARERTLTDGLQGPPWVNRLALAADQFIVRRNGGKTVVAGYPWFADWGRDTMISLPGLTLPFGRADVAKSILETFAQFVDRGMIPNRFPDTGGPAEYNTADATLWFVLAVRDYVAATGDEGFAREIADVLADIVDWHTRGTRYGIRVDPADALLCAGESGVQLTWMDAKIGDTVVTPRIGKPVEINALWYNALIAAGEVADRACKSRKTYDDLAAHARSGFVRFWNETAGYCYDVIDGPYGADDALRPNQIFAVSLPESPLEARQMRAVVDACARQLLTSYGLRTLAPSHPAYRGRCEGDPAARDNAYHQGTVWGWLLGPFALAHYRAYGDRERARAFLEPLEDGLYGYGLGTLGEIFDGDAPHEARGSLAQAWTVGETRRAWTLLSRELGG